MKYVREGKMCTYGETPAAALEERVRRLEDREAIREILHHYTRAVDRNDVGGIVSCYTEDGCFLPGDKSKPVSGRENIMEVLGRLMNADIKTSAHHIANQQIYFETPDMAVVYACFYANKSFYQGREDEITWGGYELRVVRDTDGEWRIKTHKVFFTRQDGSRTGRFGEQMDRPWPPEPEYLA